jgi:hypothetical protein
MWKEYLRTITDKCKLNFPAAVDQYAAAESALGVEVPKDLCDLLCESNGISGEYGEGLIWSVERIIEENLAFRTNADFRDLYMPFDHLLFFADAGNGDQFAYTVHADGLIHRPDVFAWKHENDSRVWVAPSLKVYLEWYLFDRIEL